MAIKEGRSQLRGDQKSLEKEIERDREREKKKKKKLL